ncbi:hypothetical protein HDV00_004115 [Rhizophlyctis rosea]|nr:hypothetical protein HDV00_004115 [Rhizophlyctis rosea]
MGRAIRAQSRNLHALKSALDIKIAKRREKASDDFMPIPGGHLAKEMATTFAAKATSWGFQGLKVSVTLHTRNKFLYENEIKELDGAIVDLTKQYSAALKETRRSVRHTLGKKYEQNKTIMRADAISKIEAFLNVDQVRGEEYGVLREVYRWFEEGNLTADTVEVLLEKLERFLPKVEINGDGASSMTGVGSFGESVRSTRSPEEEEKEAKDSETLERLAKDLSWDAKVKDTVQRVHRRNSQCSIDSELSDVSGGSDAMDQ